MKLAHHYRVLGLRRSASFGEVKKAYRQLVRKYHPDINPDKSAIDQFIQINAAYTALCAALQIPLPKGPATTTTSQTTASGATCAKASEASGTNVSERLNLQDLKLKLEKLGLGNFYKEASAAPPSQPFGQSPGQSSEPPQSVEPAAEQSSEDSSGPVPTPDSDSYLSQTAAAQVFETAESVSPQDAALKQEAYAQLRVLLSQQKFPRAIALVEGLAQRIPADLEVNQWRAIVYQRWGRHLISQGQFQKARLYLQKALKTDPNNPALKKEVSRDLGLLDHLKSAEATL